MKNKEDFMRINASGQITIPADLRKKLGLLPQTEIDIEVVDDALVIRRTKGFDKGQRMIAWMTGKGDINLTTDQILEMTRGDE